MITPKLQDRKNLPQTGSHDATIAFVPFARNSSTYLSSTVTCDRDDTTEIERRLSHAQPTFNQRRKLLGHQRLRVDLRRQRYQKCVLGVLLAGKLGRSHVKLLATFSQQMHQGYVWAPRLEILPMDVIFYQRQLRFLHRVGCMDIS